jgi:hypothetical protein
MAREAPRRGGSGHEAAQDANPAASIPAGQGDNPDMQPADESQGWNPAERVRLQITLDAETAFKLDSIARRARKPRGVIVAKMIGQICKGYRPPTIPKAVSDLLRAS